MRLINYLQLTHTYKAATVQDSHLTKGHISSILSFKAEGNMSLKASVMGNNSVFRSG